VTIEINDMSPHELAVFLRLVGFEIDSLKDESTGWVIKHLRLRIFRALRRITVKELLLRRTNEKVTAS